MPWPSFLVFVTPLFFLLPNYWRVSRHALCLASGPYLPQILLEALVCRPEQRSDAEAVGVFLISDSRLLQQRIQFITDVGLHLMAIAL